MLVSLSAGQPAVLHVEAPTTSPGAVPAARRAAREALERLQPGKPAGDDDVRCLVLASGEVAAISPVDTFTLLLDVMCTYGLAYTTSPVARSIAYMYPSRSGCTSTPRRGDWKRMFVRG